MKMTRSSNIIRLRIVRFILTIIVSVHWLLADRRSSGQRLRNFALPTFEQYLEQRVADACVEFAKAAFHF
jgi:hypothetical protein